MARVEEVRARRAGLRLAAGPAGRGLGVPCGGVGVGRQRRDPLAEPGDAVVEVAPAVANVEVQELRAAQQQAGEADRAPEVERQREGADGVEDLGGRLEPGAVGGDPAGRLGRRVR